VPPIAETSAEAAQRVTQVVRELYTSYPYPDPCLSTTSTTTASSLLELVKSLYWPFRKSMKGLRVLDAGCGTGIGALSLAARHPGVEVLGLDLSSASLELARRAARQRNLKNVSFVQGSLLDAADHGSFSYIITSGVVHHMADPIAGLRALREALTPDGVLYGMVYAQYGRTGVYLLQEAFRRLAPSGFRTVAPDAARAIATSLPANHLFDRRAFLELQWKEDAGIVDLLLHPQDRAYTVPEIVETCRDAGLKLTRFVGQYAYEPTSYALPEAEHRRAAAMPEYDRWALGELLQSRMVKHEFYATRDTFAPITIKAEGAALLSMRLTRSPTWNWGAVTEVRSDDGTPTYRVQEWIASVAARTVGIQKWQIDLIRKLDGKITAIDLFKHKAVQKSIPAGDPDAKLRLYGDVLEVLVAQEVLLTDPS
jgi:SAM-dependent methyltransferase